MASGSVDQLLSKLEQARYEFGDRAALSVLRLLTKLTRTRLPDIPSLIRFHEALLFLRAFPQSQNVLNVAERLLLNFHKRVTQQRAAGADMDLLDPLEVSGISGTTMQDVLSFDVVRWLVTQLREVEIVWDECDAERAWAAVGPKIMPLLEDDACVEADVPWQKWMRIAGNRRNLQWLVEQFERLPLSDPDRAQLYDSLRLTVRWDLRNSPWSRTRNWKPARAPFIHQTRLTSRSEVSLARELTRIAPKLTRLSRSDGKQIMDMIRQVMLVRYRELYGTTLGDPASVRRADVGRGVSIYLWNLPPERRLPLRAYVAGLTLKNGVPINYVEAIGMFEWMELGFNTFYTFRGGEAAWIYAQALRCLCGLMGTTCVSMYPYQLGKDNDEAIESGAFWFYRKLGFRPGRPELMSLTKREEQRMSRDSMYRTPAKTLRRLAEGHLFYELAGSQCGAWDKFSTRNIGMKVNQQMAKRFLGRSDNFRSHAARRLAGALGISLRSWPQLERRNFENFAVVMSLVPRVASWSRADKDALVNIIRAKSAADEMQYIRLCQRHSRLRQEMITLGSMTIA